jgi:hypothetical protein
MKTDWDDVIGMAEVVVQWRVIVKRVKSFLSHKMLGNSSSKMTLPHLLTFLKKMEEITRVYKRNGTKYAYFLIWTRIHVKEWTLYNEKINGSYSYVSPSEECQDKTDWTWL